MKMCICCNKEFSSIFKKAKKDIKIIENYIQYFKMVEEKEEPDLK